MAYEVYCEKYCKTIRWWRQQFLSQKRFGQKELPLPPARHNVLTNPQNWVPQGLRGGQTHQGVQKTSTLRSLFRLHVSRKKDEYLGRCNPDAQPLQSPVHLGAAERARSG